MRSWMWAADDARPIGPLAASILGVGLVVIGAAVGIGGSTDVPDGRVRVEGEIVHNPQERHLRGGRRGSRFLAEATRRQVRFELGGEVYETLCDYCWGSEGDAVSLAVDPANPTRNPKHLHFHRVAAVGFAGAGIAFLVIGNWWSRRHARRGPPRR